MSFDGAVIKEQGVTFAIVVVKPYVLNSPNKESIRQSFLRYFGNIPIILMTQNSRGIPTYDGRKDIVYFLANIHPSRIPWKHYTSQQWLLHKAKRFSFPLCGSRYNFYGNGLECQYLIRNPKSICSPEIIILVTIYAY